MYVLLSQHINKEILYCIIIIIIIIIIIMVIWALIMILKLANIVLGFHVTPQEWTK